MSAASVPEADPFSALPGRYIAAAGIVGDANGYLFRTTAPKSGVVTERPIHHPKSHSCKICLSDGRKSKSQTLKDAGIPVSSANDYEQLAGGRDASTITGLLALSYRTFRAKRILADRSESQIGEDPKLVRNSPGPLSARQRFRYLSCPISRYGTASMRVAVRPLCCTFTCIPFCKEPREPLLPFTV